MKIKITADSTADLSKELCEKYNITQLPLCITLGENIYTDGVNITPDMIYHHVSSTKQMPKTSAINSEQYKNFFNSVLAEGYDAIIHFNISSEMSVTHNNAKLAAEDFNNVFVVDSKTLSTGTGLQAMYASELASQEKFSAEEIYNKVIARIDDVQSSFILDKLDYLYRGGRCSAVSMFGANLLKIKPSIEVKNGKMGVGKKYMGKYDKCVLKYVQDILNTYKNPDYTRIFVTHTKVDPELVNTVIDYLKQNSKFKEIIKTTAGCTITSHCGPNTLGILFYSNKK